jgi:hypothetical protein
LNIFVLLFVRLGFFRPARSASVCFLDTLRTLAGALGRK